jgi:hypothetical protein
MSTHVLGGLVDTLGHGLLVAEGSREGTSADTDGRKYASDHVDYVMDDESLCTTPCYGLPIYTASATLHTPQCV